MRVDDGTIIDLQQRERTGENLDHVCLTVDDSVDIDALAASGAFEVVRAPRRLYGARGWGRGFYVRDPDGNVVELRNYRRGRRGARGLGWPPSGRLAQLVRAQPSHG